MNFFYISIASWVSIGIGTGLLIVRNMPINRIFGFYSNKSATNQDTWKYANTGAGKLLILSGGISLIINIINYQTNANMRIFALVNISTIISWLIIAVYINEKTSKTFDL